MSELQTIGTDPQHSARTCGDRAGTGWPTEAALAGQSDLALLDMIQSAVVELRSRLRRVQTAKEASK